MYVAVSERVNSIDERFWAIVLSDRELVDLVFEVTVDGQRLRATGTSKPGGAERGHALALPPRHRDDPDSRVFPWARSPPAHRDRCAVQGSDAV